MSLRFNMLLRDVGIDPERVLVLRHRDPRVQRQVYAAALARDPRFDDYQRSQSSAGVVRRFAKASHLAGFVAGPTGECVFAGVWALHGLSGEVYRDPFVGMISDPRTLFMFKTSRLDALDAYRGRLIVDWGRGFLSWVQWAARQDKVIAELRREIAEPEFPGFLSFQASLGEIAALPSSWLAALRASRGVYLLVHRARGDIYVGSASGGDGFYGRWLAYQNGNGGNVAMAELDGEPGDYDVSILETAGSGLDANAIQRVEARWKAKLASRLHGLNRN
jgi:hypothetical protein